MRILAAAVATACLVALAGCGSGETPPDITFTGAPSIPEPVTGLVRGTLVRVGGPLPGDPVPLKGTITFKGGPDGSTATTDVDETGRFAIGLAPGDYSITGTSPQINGGSQTCMTAKAVTTLVANQETTVNVICSIK